VQKYEKIKESLWDNRQNTFEQLLKARANSIDRKHQSHPSFF
jgi:hypothetical protein